MQLVNVHFVPACANCATVPHCASRHRLPQPGLSVRWNRSHFFAPILIARFSPNPPNWGRDESFLSSESWNLSRDRNRDVNQWDCRLAVVFWSAWIPSFGWETSLRQKCGILVDGRILHWSAFRYDRPLHLKTRGRGVTFKKSSILSFFLSTWAISNSFESVDWCYPYKIGSSNFDWGWYDRRPGVYSKTLSCKRSPESTEHSYEEESSPLELTTWVLSHTAYSCAHGLLCTVQNHLCFLNLSTFFLLRSVVWVKLYEHIALRCSTKLLYVPGFRIRPTTTTVCSSTPQQQCSAFSVNMILILCVLCKSFFYL